MPLIFPVLPTLTTAVFPDFQETVASTALAGRTVAVSLSISPGLRVTEVLSSFMLSTSMTSGVKTAQMRGFCFSPIGFPVNS